MATSATFAIKITADLKSIKAALTGLRQDIANVKASIARPGKIDLGIKDLRAQVEVLSRDLSRLRTEASRKARINFDMTSARGQIQALERKIQSISTVKPVRVTIDTKIVSRFTDQIVTARKEAVKTRDVISKPIKISQTQSAFRDLISDIRNLRTAFFTIESAGFLVQIGDEAANISARLRLATKSQEEFNKAQQETFEIAQRTGISYKLTVDTFARLERSTRELGLSQARVLALTETIAQAGALSGGGISTEAALNQLNQGLAAGQLRGQELNSVLEQTPRIAQAIADGLGVKSVGALRKLAAEGKLTAEIVANALASQRDKIQKEYDELPLTVSRALTKLRNAAIKYAQDSEGASNSTRQLAGAIDSLAKNLPAVIDAVIRLAEVWAAYKLATRVIPGIFNAIRAAQNASAAAAIAAQARISESLKAGTQGLLGFFSLAFKRLINFLVKLPSALTAGFVSYEIVSFFRDQFKEVEIAGLYFLKSVTPLFSKIAEGAEKTAAAVSYDFKNMWTDIKNFASDAFGDGFQAPKENAKDLQIELDKITDKYKKFREEFEKQLNFDINDAYTASPAERRQRAADAAAKKKREDQLALLAEEERIAKEQAAAAAENRPSQLVGIANENDLIADSISRALDRLERRYDDNLISFKEYYDKRADLQRKAIDVEIAGKKEELAALQLETQSLQGENKDTTSNLEAQSRLLTEIAIAERNRAETAGFAARDQAAAERELADELQDLQVRLLELTGNTAEARKIALERELADTRQRFELAGNNAGVAFIDNLINVELAKARLDAIEQDIDNTLQNLRANEDNITAQIEAGLIGQARGEQDLQALRERSIEQLQRYKAALEEAYNAARDPAIQEEIRKKLVGLETEVARVTASTQQFRNQLLDIGQSGLEQFFNDLTSGTKSIGDAFRGLIGNIARSIAALASENVASAIINSLGGGTGPSVDIFGKIGSFFSGFFHRGGVVGGAAPKRAVPAWAFAGAPRFHSGGIAGLKPDEVPAVLQKGEEVLAKNDARNVMNGGGQQGFRVVNVLDPRLAGDYLESSEGERVILNVIGRNPGQVRQLLG